MNWFGVVGSILGVLGISYGVRCYYELRKWVHLFKYGRVVVAYKNKVKLNAPLEEWALWCRNAEKQNSGAGPRYKNGGRILYQLGGTSIAVLSKSFVPDSPVTRLRKRFQRTEPKVNPQVQEGTWSAKDHTKR